MCLCDNIGLVALLLLGWELRASSITVLCVQAVMILSPLLFMPSLYSHSNSKNFYITCRIYNWADFSFDRVSGYRKCFYVLLFHRHILTFHWTQIGRGSVAGSQASQNDRESVMLLKLLNTISVAPNNIQLDMLSSKCLRETVQV